MKTLMVLAVLCLALCVVLPQADASCYWIRITRCYLIYSNGTWYRLCRVSYHLVCTGKRDQIDDAKGGASRRKRPDTAIIEKFPNKFSAYDKDGDNSISFDEFRTTLGDVRDLKRLQKLFLESDKNGDKVITCDEFLKAKFDFSEKPVCQ